MVNPSIETDDPHEAFAEETLPAGHLEILEERARLADEGLDNALPIEAAFQEIREALHRRQAEA